LPNFYESKNSEWLQVATAFMDAAKELNVKLRWGGDWNMDGDKTTNDDWDKPHVELLWK